MKAKFRLTKFKDVLIFDEELNSYQEIGYDFFKELLEEKISKEIYLEFTNEEVNDYKFYIHIAGKIKLTHETFSFEHFTENVESLAVFENEIKEFIARVREWFDNLNSDEREIEF